MPLVEVVIPLYPPFPITSSRLPVHPGPVHEITLQRVWALDCTPGASGLAVRPARHRDDVHHARLLHH